MASPVTLLGLHDVEEPSLSGKITGPSAKTFKIVSCNHTTGSGAKPRGTVANVADFFFHSECKRLEAKSDPGKNGH